MQLLEKINDLFDDLIKYESSLVETSLSKDILHYSGDSIESLKKDLYDARNCITNFVSKYDKDSLLEIDKINYSDDYHSCITYLAMLLALYGGKKPRTYRSIFQIFHSLNDISRRFFEPSDGVILPPNELLRRASELRHSNAELRQYFHRVNESLKEHKLSQFDTSKITDKAISEYGLNEAKLIDASFGKDSITIQFEVESTGDNTHVDLTGKTQVFLKRGYSVTIQFTKTDNYLSPTNVNKDAIAQQFNSVIQNCDAKVYCDCPAFYWQGMAEKDAKQGDSYFGFRGQHGTGCWNDLHNVKGPQACKHIWSAIYFVNTEQKQICDKLASKIVNSANVYDNVINQN